MLPVLRSEVAYFQLTTLFAYILSNFLELISNGWSERLAISFTDVEVIRRDLLVVVYFAVNRKVHLPLLPHREHIKAGFYFTIFELP